MSMDVGVVPRQQLACYVAAEERYRLQAIAGPRPERGTAIAVERCAECDAEVLLLVEGVRRVQARRVAGLAFAWGYIALAVPVAAGAVALFRSDETVNPGTLGTVLFVAMIAMFELVAFGFGGWTLVRWARRIDGVHLVARRDVHSLREPGDTTAGPPGDVGEPMI